MMKKEKILVPLDGSECAERILPRVEKLAAPTKTGISLLKVVFAHTFPGVDPTEAEVAVVREAEAYLEGIKERLAAKGFDVDTHVRYGDDAEEILAHSIHDDIDIIAMSTQMLQKTSNTGGQVGWKRLRAETFKGSFPTVIKEFLDFPPGEVEG